MNKLLMEENDRLQKQASQLVYENGYYRQQTQSVSRLITSPHPPPALQNQRC
jgi:homeobox-leucine zipper protein